MTKKDTSYKAESKADPVVTDPPSDPQRVDDSDPVIASKPETVAPPVPDATGVPSPVLPNTSGVINTSAAQLDGEMSERTKVQLARFREQYQEPSLAG